MTHINSNSVGTEAVKFHLLHSHISATYRFILGTCLEPNIKATHYVQVSPGPKRKLTLTNARGGFPQEAESSCVLVNQVPVPDRSQRTIEATSARYWLTSTL